MNQPTPAVAQTSKPPSPTQNPGEHKSSPAIAFIVLRPTSRNVGQSPAVELPQGTQQVKVQLSLEADNHKSYKASLVDAADEVKWSQRHLKSESADSGRAVVLSLPATLLKKGEYTVILGPDEDSARPIAEYVFVVQKK